MATSRVSRPYVDGEAAALDQPNEFVELNTFAKGIVSVSASVSDDEVLDIDLGGGASFQSYVMAMTGSSNVPRGLWALHVGDGGPAPGSDELSTIINGTDFDIVIDTPLNGTTGTDGNYTLSINSDGTMQFENRNGGTRNVRMTFQGG